MIDSLDQIYNPLFWIFLNVTLVVILTVVAYNLSKLKGAAKHSNDVDEEYLKVMSILKGESDEADQREVLKRYVESFLKFASKRVMEQQLTPGKTLREVLCIIADKTAFPHEKIKMFYELYEPVRFGGNKMSSEELAKIRAILIELTERIAATSSSRSQQA